MTTATDPTAANNARNGSNCDTMFGIGEMICGAGVSPARGGTGILPVPESSTGETPAPPGTAAATRAAATAAAKIVGRWPNWQIRVMATIVRPMNTPMRMQIKPDGGK